MKNSIFFLSLVLILFGCNKNITEDTVVVDFSVNNDSLSFMDTIQFTNLSKNATTYFWDFGDSVVSAESQPKHLYNHSGSYNVKLQAFDGELMREISKVIKISTVKPFPVFSVIPMDNIKIWDMVSFTNQSIFSTNAHWDFGDGTFSSEINALHQFNTPGLKTVNLTSSNSENAETVTKSFYVNDTVNLNYYSWEDRPNFPDDYDIDGDKIPDLHFRIYIDQGHSTWNVIYITAQNGYEISIDSVDTNSHPTIYHYGDRVYSNSNFSNKQLVLTYSVYYMYPEPHNSIYNEWIKDEIRYIGFRKALGGVTKMGWLKVKITGFTKIYILGYKIPTQTDNLLIDK